ncbi:class I SAM-dependent RNA methyltransferase, partial [Dietzia sp. DQ12-76]|nr:class I SAM-dependent RNA methyltransferase [Dietzia sp. DQ12-76]
GEWEPVAGAPTVTRRVGERTWRLPVDAFWQAHRSAAAHYSELVRTAVSGAPALPGDPVVWDLYGGAGLFSAAVLDVVPRARVIVVESSPASLEAVGSALGIGPAVVPVASRVEPFLERSSGSGDRGDEPDLVILDPPRGGAGIEVMATLARGTASRIVHVGCDPASLARDVGVLVSAGWTLAGIRGVAAFPATHHVEGLAVLDSPRVR